MNTRVLYFVLLSLCSLLVKSQSTDFLQFTENKGQWHDDILFQSTIPNGELFLGKGKLLYYLYNGDDLAQIEEHKHQHSNHSSQSRQKKSAPKNASNKELILRQHTVSVTFENSLNVNSFTTKGLNKSYSNYIYGNDPEKWTSNVKSYRQITYNNLYEGISWNIFNDGNKLKHEFIVKPHADPKQIKIKFEGTDSTYIAFEQLYLATSVGNIIEHKPFAYQLIKGKKTPVECKFKLKKNTLTFEIGRYHKHHELVIDPELIFSTSSGSTADNWGNSACVDDKGNLYGVGTVFSSHTAGSADYRLNGFPATPGAFQTSFTSDIGGTYDYAFTDIAVMKFNPDGTDLLYATYIGGRECDVPTSSIVDKDGNLLILSVTSSNNLPKATNTFSGGPHSVPGTFHNFPSGTDIAIIKLNPDGTDVIATRYMGGTNNDGVMDAYYLIGGFFNRFELVNNYGDQFRGDINVDEEGNIYAGSMSNSLDFPTVNAYQATNNGFMNAVAFKLSPDLSSIIWSTYLGGSGADACYGVYKDTENNLFITGGTYSTDFPTTENALHTDLQGDIDGFIARISNTGDSLIASSYVGTTNFDQSYFVQLDTNNNAYLLGQTKGDYKPTSGAYNVENGGLFIHKLTPQLDSTFFISTFGSDNPDPASITPNISPTAFLVNDCENMFVSGWGGASNGQTSYFDYRYDGVISVDYNGGETRNMYTSTYADKGEDETDGSDFYLFVLQKNAQQPLYGTYYGGNTTINGQTSEEHVDGGTSRFDKQGIVYQSVCANCGGNESTFPVYPDDGDQNTFPKASASGNCNNGLFKFDLANLEASFTFEYVCDEPLVNFQNTSLGGVDFSWIFGDGSDTLYQPTPSSASHLYDSAGKYTVSLIATDLTTCTGKDTATIQINIPDILVPKKYNDTSCYNTPIQVKLNDSTNKKTYIWTPDRGLSSSTVFNPIITLDTSQTYLVQVTDTNGCFKTDTVEIYVNPIIPQSLNFKVLGTCSGETPKVQFEALQKDTYSYLWDFGDGQNSTEAKPLHQYEQFKTYNVSLTIQETKCSNLSSQKVEVVPIKIPNIFTPNNDGTNDQYVVKGIEDTGEWKLEVHNRWGKLIFDTQHYDNAWDGGHLEDGTYYYLLTAPDETTCKGWVQIVR